MAFKLIPMGACREVGRSSFLLDVGDKILLDRGLKLTPEEIEYPLRVNTQLDAVIISHAHLDHSGDLPHLFVRNHPIAYMTPPTLDLAELLWHDSLKIAGIEGIDAKFSKADIRRTRKYTFPTGYREPLEITDKVKMELFDAGHIVRLELGIDVGTALPWRCWLGGLDRLWVLVLELWGQIRLRFKLWLHGWWGADRSRVTGELVDARMC